MTKILNLDKLVAEAQANRRVLKINGVDHPINEMTVDNFITTNMEAERIAQGSSLGEQVQATVDMICRSVPSAPRDILGGYSLPILHTITAFVRGDDVDEAETEAQAEEGAGAGN